MKLRSPGMQFHWHHQQESPLILGLSCLLFPCFQFKSCFLYSNRIEGQFASYTVIQNVIKMSGQFLAHVSSTGVGYLQNYKLLSCQSVTFLQLRYDCVCFAISSHLCALTCQNSVDPKDFISFFPD